MTQECGYNTASESADKEKPTGFGDAEPKKVMLKRGQEWKHGAERRGGTEPQGMKNGVFFSSPSFSYSPWAATCENARGASTHAQASDGRRPEPRRGELNASLARRRPSDGDQLAGEQSAGNARPAQGRESPSRPVHTHRPPSPGPQVARRATRSGRADSAKSCKSRDTS